MGDGGIDDRNDCGGNSDVVARWMPSECGLEGEGSADVDIDKGDEVYLCEKMHTHISGKELEDRKHAPTLPGMKARCVS